MGWLIYISVYVNFFFICIIYDHFYSSVLCYVEISILIFEVKLTTTLSGFYECYFYQWTVELHPSLCLS